METLTRALKPRLVMRRLMAKLIDWKKYLKERMENFITRQSLICKWWLKLSRAHIFFKKKKEQSTSLGCSAFSMLRSLRGCYLNIRKNLPQKKSSVTDSVIGANYIYYLQWSKVKKGILSIFPRLSNFLIHHRELSKCRRYLYLHRFECVTSRYRYAKRNAGGTEHAPLKRALCSVLKA